MLQATFGIQGGKREKEEYPKSKSTLKVVDSSTCGKDKEASKDVAKIKRLARGSANTFLQSLGGPRENLPFEGMMKIKITKMLVLHKKDGEIFNNIFPLVITTIIGKFDVSRIRPTTTACAISCNLSFLRRWASRKEFYGHTKALTCRCSTVRHPF